MIEAWTGIHVWFAAHVAVSPLPIMPAVFRIDITVSATIIHFAGISSFHHNAIPAVANRVNLVLCERRPLFVFHVDEKDDERRHEYGHDIVGIRFHVQSLRITPEVTRAYSPRVDRVVRPFYCLSSGFGNEIIRSTLAFGR